MKKILVVGSLNMDLVVRAPYIPKAGETIIGSGLFRNPGGKGGNQAGAIGKLGGQVQMLACVGDDDDGRVLVGTLEGLNVDTSKVMKAKDANSGMALITVGDNGDNNIVVVAGANNLCSIEYIDSVYDAIMECDYVVLQMEIPMTTVKYVISKGKELGKIIVLNPAPACLLDSSILNKVDYLVPNESELEILTNIKCDSRKGIMEACAKLEKMGCNHVIVTLGSQGSLYYYKGDYKTYPAMKVEVIDTTAAGDSFIAGVIISLAEGLDIDKSIEYATKVASITIGREGAINSIPYKDEV